MMLVGQGFDLMNQWFLTTVNFNQYIYIMYRRAIMATENSRNMMKYDDVRDLGTK